MQHEPVIGELEEAHQVLHRHIIAEQPGVPLAAQALGGCRLYRGDPRRPALRESRVGTQPARHLELLSSTPKKDQTVGSAPVDIALIFSESADSAKTTIALQGPDGPVELAAIRLQDEGLVVLAKVVGPAPAGTYTVSWGAAAPDQDPIKGSFRYTVRQER